MAEAAAAGEAYEQGDAAPVAPSTDAPAFASRKYTFEAQRESACFDRVAQGALYRADAR